MRYKILEGFMSRDECGQLIDMARPRLEQATTWDVQTRQRQVSNFRTNEFMFFLPQENDLVRSIEERIASATGYPIENGEGLQCARYHPGQYFKAHWDSFDPSNDGNQEMLVTGGQRVTTFMVYLNDIPEGYGGETWFTHENLRVRPEAGKALYWANGLEEDDQRPDPTTLHEAVTTMHPYQKWIITKWIRKSAFVAAVPFQYSPAYQQQQQQLIKQREQELAGYHMVQGPPLVHQPLSPEEQKAMEAELGKDCCPEPIAEPIKKKRGRPRKNKQV